MIYGTLTDQQEIFDAVASDDHDVVCELPVYLETIRNKWHDISLPLPGCSYLRIPDDGLAGGVFPYDGVQLKIADGTMEIAYTVSDFLIAFIARCDLPEQCISIGAGSSAPVITAEEAAQIFRAIGTGDLPEVVEGFERVSLEMPEGVDECIIWCKELDCGLTFCVDAEQEAWVQISGKLEGMYDQSYDIQSMSNDGKVLRVRTDRRIFILPIGGVA